MRYKRAIQAGLIITGLYLVMPACTQEPHLTAEEHKQQEQIKELERMLQETAALLKDSLSVTRPLQYLHPRPGTRFDASYEDQLLWLLYQNPMMPFGNDIDDTGSRGSITDKSGSDTK